MNKKEKMAVQPTNEFVANMLRQRNKGTEDCITTSEYARKIGMNAPDLNRFLEDQNVIQRKNGLLQLTLKYQERGLTKNRSTFKYSRMGQLKEIVYPVWTPKGVAFLNKFLNVKQ